MFGSRFLWRLFAGYALIIILITAAVGLVVTHRIKKDALREIEEELEAIGQQARTEVAAEIAAGALANSRILVTRDLPEAVAVSNRYAPEHLILSVDDPESLMDSVTAAGSVFLGHWTPESLGDYCSGTNHVLPTYGFARAFSGLGVEDFQRRITVQSATPEGLKGIGPTAVTLARLEGDVTAPLDDFFDLLELLRVVRDDVAFEAGAVGIEVTLQVPDREELVMRGNAELLRRAVENVVRNALQHAGESKRIEILLDDPEERRSVRLRFRDHGEGVDENRLESLFAPFARGRASGGFGLGLAIAHRAVAINKGSIRAKSPPRGGLEVQIELPLDDVRQKTSGG